MCQLNVILRVAGKEAVTQVEVEGHTLLNGLREAEEEICEVICDPGLARVGGVLAVEGERAGSTLTASVDIIHDVVVELKPAVKSLLPVSPGKRVFSFNGGVVEDLNPVRIANRAIAEGH